MNAPPEREQLRTIFGEDAELYNRMRPAYPEALFVDLAEFGRLAPGLRVLDIGCGTGQATRPLAERGFDVTAIDLSPDMVAVARRTLVAFPRVEVLVADFDSWALPAQPFDAVISATAFHWLDPATRVTRVAEALRPGGTFGLISTEHVAGGDTDFFTEAQSCYERWDPATPPGLRLEPADAIPTKVDELDRSGLFEPTAVRRYTWSRAYTATEYRNLLLTYSGHRALEAWSRQQLLDCITDLIETRYSGRVIKQYMNQLALVRRH